MSETKHAVFSLNVPTAEEVTFIQVENASSILGAYTEVRIMKIMRFDNYSEIESCQGITLDT